MWLLLALASARATPATSEDPVVLEQLGRAAAEAGDLDEARTWFGAWLDHSPIRAHLPLGPLREAIVDERLGERTAAARTWRAELGRDPVLTVLALGLLSEHPERDALLAEGYDHVRGLAERAASGGAPIRITEDERTLLQPTTAAEVLQAAEAGRMVQDAWIPELVLRDPLPEEIVLDGCVVGSLDARGATLGRLTVVRSVILGDLALADPLDRALDPSSATVRDLSLRGTIVLGDASLAGVALEQRAALTLSHFAGRLDLREVDSGAGADLRFTTFRGPIDWRGSRWGRDVQLGHAVLEQGLTLDRTTFGSHLYLDELDVRGDLTMSATEVGRRLTLEHSAIDGALDLRFLRVGEALNLSRADLRGTVDLQDVQAKRLVALGTDFRDIAFWMGLEIEEDLQLSLDEEELLVGQIDAVDLRYVYRYDPGDDAADPAPSYGVRSTDDLVSRLHGGFVLTSSSIGGDAVFRDVAFGTDRDFAYAAFRSTRVGGSGDFEGARFADTADFTGTSFYNALDLSDARLSHGDLVLSGLTVLGRLDLRGTAFTGEAMVDMEGATVGSIQGDWEQIRRIERPGGAWLRLTQLPLRGFPWRVAGILYAWAAVAVWWALHGSRVWQQPTWRRVATASRAGLAVITLALSAWIVGLLAVAPAAVVLGTLSAAGPILVGSALRWRRSRTLALAAGTATLSLGLLVATYVFLPSLSHLDVEWGIAAVPFVGATSLYLLERLRKATGPLVFISYRRSDDPGFTGRLHDHLVQRMPERRFFMDIDAVQIGQTFGPQLADAVRECDVMLVVMGAGWAEARDRDGRRRLDIEEDWVRQEIEIALLHDRPIVPVLLRDTALPPDDALPSSLKPLLGFTAARVTHEGFGADTEQLMRVIRRLA